MYSHATVCCGRQQSKRNDAKRAWVVVKRLNLAASIEKPAVARMKISATAAWSGGPKRDKDSAAK